MAHRAAHFHFLTFLYKHVKSGNRLLDVGGEGGVFRDATVAIGAFYLTLNFNHDADYNMAATPYDWSIAHNSFDCVVSSSTFEHVAMFWLTFSEMCRVTKPGGLVYLCVPSAGVRHWDLDCWRFQKDSMAALAEWGKVALLEAFLDEEGPEWKDVIGVFRKPVDITQAVKTI